ncbi:MAG TPA: serine/threonine-protein kinase [Thermoanaerobaculia bacterium]
MSHRERWAEVKSLLEQALEVPAEERGTLFARLGAPPALVAEVEGLLAFEDHAEGFIDEPVFSFRKPAPDLEAGRRLGPWRLLRPLGNGGMGAVYLAERADRAFDLTVAVKLLKTGLDTEELISRFEAERHILARLIHPNIARLLDGGTGEDGRPYLVMEYVEGEPIDEYCDRRRLPTRERLELFRSVCSAVQLAHQNLVVHRDLKPANILVTADGAVKLLDFGIAKLLPPPQEDSRVHPDPTLAHLGGAPLTPRYASPEQVRGEPITTASDVYSLGVVLYELLTGHRPYRLDTPSPTEIERVVCEAVPLRPSTAVRRSEEIATADGLPQTPEAVAELREGDIARLSRRLAGDLDTILLTALRKEPERRFASAEQLSEDIRLYLAGLPIRSRPDSFGYRAGKFLTRHAFGVTVATGGLLLLLAFAGAMTWQRAEIAARSREVAQERDRAEATKEFLLKLIGQADPRQAKGREITIREALDQRASRLAQETGLDPATRADLLDALGVAYRSLGRDEQAGPLLKEALALRRQALGAGHVRVAESLLNLANLERQTHHLDEAERLMRQALAIQRRAFPKGHQDLARGLNNFASLLREKATRADQVDGPLLLEAEALARESLAMKQRLFGQENEDVAASLNTLAGVLMASGKPAEAEPLLRRSIALRRKLDGLLSPGLAKAINNLAVLLADEGRLTEAEALHRESLSMRRQLYPDGHQDLLRSLQNLSDLRARQGDSVEAAALSREAAELTKRLKEDREAI